MDPLSDVLRVARLSGGVFLNAEFSAPWCMAAKATPGLCAPYLNDSDHIVLYHYVVEGTLGVRVGEAPPLYAHAREIILLPHNDVHLLGGDLNLPPTPGWKIITPAVNNGLATIHHGDGGEPTRLVCGFLSCERIDNNPILSALPALFKFSIDQGGTAEWMRTTFQFAADEVADGKAGSGAVLTKLSELLFVEAVRRYAETLPEGQTGWLAGLRDPFVSRALTLLHGELARAWTVDDLGREVGLSRSALAERFVGVIGQPPMQYLKQWRMQVAAQELRSGHQSLLTIARNVGYDSEAAFTRAFKKQYDAPPATWRRQSLETTTD